MHLNNINHKLCSIYEPNLYQGISQDGDIRSLEEKKADYQHYIAPRYNHNYNNNRPTFDIKRQIGSIRLEDILKTSSGVFTNPISSTGRSVWKNELNIIAWNNAKANYDLRAWSQDHSHMGKGIRFDVSEAIGLCIILSNEFDYIANTALSNAQEQSMLNCAAHYIINTLNKYLQNHPLDEHNLKVNDNNLQPTNLALSSNESKSPPLVASPIKQNQPKEAIAKADDLVALDIISAVENAPLASQELLKSMGKNPYHAPNFHHLHKSHQVKFNGGKPL